MMMMMMMMFQPNYLVTALHTGLRSGIFGSEEGFRPHALGLTPTRPLTKHYTLSAHRSGPHTPHMV